MAAPAVADTISTKSALPMDSDKSKNSQIPIDDLAKRKYVKWGTPGIINPPPNEAEDIQAVVEQINTVQKKTFNKTRHAFGGTHARTQGILKGKLIVGELPPHLAQTELFAQPGEFPVAARYSTEPGDPGLDDRAPNPRGFAMKIFNVKGDFFEAGKDYPTHDIEFNSTPVLDLADAKTTREIFDIRLKYGHDEEELKKQLKKRDDAELQLGRYGVHNTHLESIRQYSQSAYRFGDYIVKYSLVPSSEAQRKLYEETVREEHGDDILHRWLEAFHAQHEAEYLFQVQFLENIEEQPVEYAGTPWDPAKYPFQTIATLKFPPQNSFDFERKTYWEQFLRLDPFLGLKSFEPIGSSNRLRKVVYPASSALRRKMNGVKVIHVTSIDQIPN